jgi:hypothetical protein
MASNTERGKAFQMACRDALVRATGRTFDIEVAVAIAEGQRHFFDLATRERDVFIECKAFAFTVSGNNADGKVNILRTAATQLRLIKGDVLRVLMVKHAQHPNPKRGERSAPILSVSTGFILRKLWC